MKNLEIKEITFEEAMFINGGHDGTAYEAGRATMKILKGIVLFAAIVALW